MKNMHLTKSSHGNTHDCQISPHKIHHLFYSNAGLDLHTIGYTLKQKENLIQVI